MPELRASLGPQVADLRARQLASWLAGKRVLIDDLLAGQPELLADQEALLELIYAEVLLREEHGERPQVEEYVQRFPSCEAALGRQFAFHDAFGVLDTDGLLAGSIATRTEAPAPETNEAPTEIGPYQVLGELGRGGMGIVYKGRHRALNRLAAIKVLRSGEGGAEEGARFLTEARTVASLHHPNIVRVYDVFHPTAGEGDPFVAFEYVEGGSLAERVNGTPLPPRTAAALLLPLAEAIHQAHLQGLIHRDVKPANVLLRTTAKPQAAEGGAACGLAVAVPKITDFGLAKQLDADMAQTRTGVILGTPSYMAPEQAHGLKDVGPPADVYGLGAVLYEMLTGRPPFKADTVLNTLAQVVAEEPVSPRTLQPGVPRDLETICLKCLNKAPGRRYASADDLAGDLRRFLHGEPIVARPAGVVERAVKWVKRRPAAAGLIGVACLALGVLVAMGVAFTVRLDAERNEAVRQTGRAEREKDEARKQEKIALAERTEAQRQAKRARHLIELTSTAVDKIALEVGSSKQAESASRNTGEVLFKLACFYAKASTLLAGDTDLGAEGRGQLAEQYAVSAVRLLVCAKQVGFFEPDRPANRKNLEKSADLAVLRSRPDYKRFKARLHDK